MKMLIAIGVLMFSAVMATTSGQNTKLKKPYEQWTATEVTQILSDSQWARTNLKITGERPGSDASNYPPETNFLVQLRLYSALPIRQALVRRMHLTIPYADLTVAQRASFDAEVDGLLKCPQCAENYVVTLSSGPGDRLKLMSGSSSVMIDVVALMKRVPEDELVRHVSLLNDKGERRTATRVLTTKKHELVFLFPRFDDQRKPLITVSNKKFYLDFDEYLSRKAEGALKKFKFDVIDLVQDGEVMF